MQDIIAQFIEAMRAAGSGPADISEIQADDKRRRYRLDSDKRNQRTGSYQLRIDDDFGFGWFRNFRIGESVNWHSKSDRTYTAEERAAWKYKAERDRAALEAERDREADNAAEKAVRLWDKANTIVNGHTYLARKGILAYVGPARLRSNLLVIPAYNARNTLRTLQFIASDGEKRFLTGGEKSGCFCPIAAKTDDRSKIVICEGYATGISIRLATMMPVIVAFDAGNLTPVAEIFRKRYPDSEIIIAADNDAFTVGHRFKPADIDISSLSGTSEFWAACTRDGHLINTGIEKGKAAAEKVGGRCVWPEFSDVTARPTDFNDLHTLDGLDAVKEQITAERPVIEEREEEEEPEEPPAWVTDFIPYNEDFINQTSLYSPQKMSTTEDTDKPWQDKLSRKKDGSICGRSVDNLIVYLNNDEVLSEIFCYDEFSKMKYVYRCPPWERPNRFRPRPVGDTDVTYLTAYIERLGFNLGFQSVQRALDAVIKNNPCNPAQEYFKGLKWDGVKRLDTWLHKYCGATLEPESYVSVIGRKWLCAIVARVFEPGTKFDYMLVLEGAQGIGKSSMLKELATVHGKAYFDDTIKIRDLGSKEIVPKLQGVLIIEIAELAGIRNKDVDELKSAITTTTDRLILKYQNEPTEFPRQFVLAGTINPTDGYLTDSTGNRRFWPIEVSTIDMKGIRRDKEQIFAEAVEAVKNGEDLTLPQELYIQAAAVTDDRLSEHPWLDEVSAHVNGLTTVPVRDLWEKLGISDRTKRTHSASIEIFKIMTRLGYKKNRRRSGNGVREYYWIRTDNSIPTESDEEIEFD